MVDEQLIETGDFSDNSGYEAMKRLLARHPDAVFAASDVMAVGAMRAAREAGLGIPDDVAFVGFDDLPLAENSLIKLTTVRQPISRLGAHAVELLLDVIATGIKPLRHVILGTELIVRESCGAKKLEAVSSG